VKKTDKESLVDKLSENFKRSNATFVTDYKGMKAIDMDEIRKSLRESSVELKIVRNTLARRAVDGTAFEHLKPKFVGPSAIAFSYKDAAAAAKLLVQFSKDKPNLKIIGGALGAKAMGLEDIKGLADLPPRDVLLAKMLGSMKSPATGIVTVFAGIPKKLLYALNAIKDAKASSAA